MAHYDGMREAPEASTAAKRQADPNRDLKELRYEMAEKAVAAAERGVDLAKDKAERIVREARHEAYLAYCERNEAMRVLGIHPDQLRKPETPDAQR